jgi:hypothetical protein
MPQLTQAAHTINNNPQNQQNQADKQESYTNQRITSGYLNQYPKFLQISMFTSVILNLPLPFNCVFDNPNNLMDHFLLRFGRRTVAYIIPFPPQIIDCRAQTKLANHRLEAFIFPLLPTQTHNVRPVNRRIRTG